ncbi:ABC transporter ATP-binding protein [Rhodopirellula sp.]|nr:MULTISPECIES: ABC transporter ATP-binding protein [Pirellulaceae]MDB4338914.1 ABC transporter ATP-binding protein [Rubripirellula sp.]MDB4679245.1 ABC transporter ATP-binding protein [Rhodopirellula sp.]
MSADSVQDGLPATGPVVHVRGLTKRYSGWSLFGKKPIDALRGVDISARGGEVFGLLGPNGAGKTTLIKVLLGVVKPTGGEATLFGQSVGSISARQRVGYLPEALRVDRHHTARSALHYYGRLSGMGVVQIAKRSDELLELVGLRDRDRESVARFSKGMYQRLGLAQALMHDPDLLILDEPTDGLDPVGRNEVRKVIDRLCEQGKTIFLNSHILQEVEMVCTRVAILSRGKIRGTGTVRQLSEGLASEVVNFELMPREGSELTPVIEAIAQELNLESHQLQPSAADENITEFTARLPERHQVDQVVDRLRGSDVSILGLEMKRPTLEELFMQLVNGDDS